MEIGTALGIAAAGIAWMIWWPVDGDMVIIPDPEPETIEEEIIEEEEAPETEPEPEPVPEPEPEPAPEPTDDAGDAFVWMPAGDLVSGSGTGQSTQSNYTPGMRFPMEAAQAYANSQVYGAGGYLGPAGGQCDGQNYSYAWHDNFCETRGYGTPMCPSGTGHQGQDIRPATCQAEIHWAVAADSGTITSVGTYSVRMTSDDGVRYSYLHLDMDDLLIEVGDVVTSGQRLGYVSNDFGGTPTTIHLHFEIKMSVDTGAGIQNTHVPPYLALVDSYQGLIDGDES